MATERTYEGDELDLFSAATRWKKYWSGRIRPRLGPTVLEVGAGFGTNTPYLCGPSQTRWLCLEPDSSLAARIPGHLSPYPWRNIVETKIGTLKDLSPGPEFDSLVYIDVLEHIPEHREEMANAFRYLKPGGKVIVLSPAHPFLFTEFDRTIGHCRRYTKSTLRAVSPAGSQLEELYYLDSVGLLASLANKTLLHQSMPTLPQVLFWDKWLVGSSRFLDPLIGRTLGKTIVGIWSKA